MYEPKLILGSTEEEALSTLLIFKNMHSFIKGR